MNYVQNLLQNRVGPGMPQYIPSRCFSSQSVIQLESNDLKTDVTSIQIPIKAVGDPISKYRLHGCIVHMYKGDFNPQFNSIPFTRVYLTIIKIKAPYNVFPLKCLLHDEHAISPLRSPQVLMENFASGNTAF